LESPVLPIPQSLSELQEKHSSASTLGAKDLLPSLLQLTDELRSVYVVFDAIDEAEFEETRRSLLELIDELRKSTNMRILITGRPHCEDVNNYLQNVVSIAIAAQPQDIRAFVAHHTQGTNPARHLDDRFKQTLSDRLVSSSHGQFLLPALQLKRILREPTRGDMEDALESMPDNLVGILDDNIRRVLRQSHSRRSLALDVLVWLCHAQTPLNAADLPDLLSLNNKMRRPKASKYRPSQRIIVECCQGLVYFNEAERTFHIVHLAVQERLKSLDSQIFGSPMVSIVAKSCLLYILDPAFDHGPIISGMGADNDLEATETEIGDFLDQHPFFEYASRQCGSHISSLSHDVEIRGLIGRVLGSQPRVARLAQINRYSRGFREEYWSMEEAWSSTGVHMASEFGLTTFVCELIDSGNAQINGATSIGHTLIIRAASQDQIATVCELLSRGADPYKSNWYGNALHCAAENNAITSLKELLNRGFDPNTLSPLGRSALSCAFDNDCVEAAELLLSHGGVIVPGVENVPHMHALWERIAELERTWNIRDRSDIFNMLLKRQPQDIRLLLGAIRTMLDLGWLSQIEGAELQLERLWQAAHG
jgi:hypothetical protein